MKKTFMGVRLKRLREERGLNQLDLARALELSPSYLNQLENNQRPLTVPVLLRIQQVFNIDVQWFSENDEARLIADLRELFPDAPDGQTISLAETRELAANMPAVARTLIGLYRRLRQEQERAEALAARLGDDRDGLTKWPLTPYEEVRDFFYARHNYIDELDRLAERLFAECACTPVDLAPNLIKRLAEKHGVRVLFAGDDASEIIGLQRRWDPVGRVLFLSPRLERGQLAFQLATQLAFLETAELIDRLADQGNFGCDESRSLTRIGLANYFAGALILPYAPFLHAAEALRYDIGILEQRFGVGFETICHRLSTLQRTDARGVPFLFVRVDRAGNISKRQSATNFHFSRIGGTCPLWNVYEAFAFPGRILAQMAAMPDGRTYLWIARTVSRTQGAYGMPSKTFAIGLGCDLHHAERLVYSKGMDLKHPEATPIGVACKVCDHLACPQRAFPPISKKLVIDPNRSYFEPYRAPD